MSQRAACFSAATRMKSHLSFTGVDDSCRTLTGDHKADGNEGHIRTCTIVPQSQWDNTDIQCTKEYWASGVERCNADEITSFDNEVHSPDTSNITATFEIVKAQTDGEPTCDQARAYFSDK
jgi:hypothetical protein